jgi:hypothetical protein
VAVPCTALDRLGARWENPPMYLFATLCAGFYLIAQTLQRILLLAVLPEYASPLDELLGSRAPAETLRAVAILSSMFLMVPVYAAVALRRFRRSPGAAVCGFAFGLLFVAFEVAYRSLDLFLVGGTWADAVRADPAAAAAVLERVALWEQAVGAWYFPLLTVHLGSTIAFTFACWPRRGGDRWDWLAAAAFGLNGIRLAGRLLGGYGGVAWLGALSQAWYFPLVAVVMTLLTIWLARQVVLARRESLTPPALP